MGTGQRLAAYKIPTAIVVIPLPRDMATVVLAIEASPSRRCVSEVGVAGGGGKG